MPAPVSGASGTAFREALAHFASGVTIVTARARPLNPPVGFTASAFCAVSLAPPLVLVCVSKTASGHAAVTEGGFFGVSVLSERQGWLATQFATSGIDRFEGVDLRAESSERPPLIEGALAHLQCQRHAMHDAGDHTIVVGLVLDVSVAAGQPLVHFVRHFGGFALAVGRAVPAEGEAPRS